MKKPCTDGHNPCIFDKKVGPVHRSTKCIDCGETLVSIAGSKWMTNYEYMKYITQEIGVKT